MWSKLSRRIFNSIGGIRAGRVCRRQRPSRANGYGIRNFRTAAAVDRLEDRCLLTDTLSLTLAAASISEQGGFTTGTVTRTAADISQEQLVRVYSDSADAVFEPSRGAFSNIVAFPDGSGLIDLGVDPVTGRVVIGGWQETGGDGTMPYVITLTDDRTVPVSQQLVGLYDDESTWTTPTIVRAVSSDGRTVVGNSDFEGRSPLSTGQGVLWDPDHPDQPTGVGLIVPDNHPESPPWDAISGGAVGDVNGLRDAYLYTPEHGIQALFGHGLEIAKGASLHGEIVTGLSSWPTGGVSAVYWDQGVFRVLESGFGGQSEAWDASPDGTWISGYTTDFNIVNGFPEPKLHPAVWDADRTLTIPTFADGTLVEGQIIDINDSGYAVGKAVSGPGTAGLIWSPTFDGVQSQFSGAVLFDDWFEAITNTTLPAPSTQVTQLAEDKINNRLLFTVQLEPGSDTEATGWHFIEVHVPGISKVPSLLPGALSGSPAPGPWPVPGDPVPGPTPTPVAPFSVVIPAGDTSADFVVHATDNALIDGDRAVSIVVAADGFADQSTSIQVTDHEPDFGDAPESYETTFLGGGAVHFNDGPRLGTLRDAEQDARVPFVGSGDDNQGEDDEDGVEFPEPFLAGVTVNINVSSATGGELDYFFDFDGDGTFGNQPNEVFSTTLSVGSQQIGIPIPSDTPDGVTYARFRISSSGGAGPTGAIDDGEVEDYAVYVHGDRAISAPEFERQRPVGGAVFKAELDDALQTPTDVDSWIVSLDGGESLSVVADPNGTDLLQVELIQVAPSVPVAESEPNESIATAQDLELAEWSVAYVENITDASLVNTSADYPHISVQGSGDNTTSDFFAFDVGADGVRGIFDIDLASQQYRQQLRLYDDSGTLLASAPPGSGINADPGSVSPHPLLEFDFLTFGRYFIEVLADASTLSPLGNYTLHVSVQGHSVNAPEQILLTSVAAAGPGETVVVDPVHVSNVDGTLVQVRVSGSQPDFYHLKFIRNAVIEELDSTETTPLALDNSAIDLTTGTRWSVLGSSDAVLEEAKGRLFVIPLTRSPYFDIVEIDPRSGDELNRISLMGIQGVDGPEGLAFDGTYLWYMHGSAGSSGENQIYQIDAATGQIVDIDSLWEPEKLNNDLLNPSQGYDGLEFVDGKLYILN